MYLQKEGDEFGNLKEPQDTKKTIWSLHNSASPAPSPSCQAGQQDWKKCQDPLDKVAIYFLIFQFSFTQDFPRYFKLIQQHQRRPILSTVLLASSFQRTEVKQQMLSELCLVKTSPSNVSNIKGIFQGCKFLSMKCCGMINHFPQQLIAAVIYRIISNMYQD